MGMLKPHSLPRSLLAALLQTGWGVAPSYETWSVFHNTTLHNWLWSVGRTPFGPFSDKTEVSFVQRTAAQRNVVLTSLNQAVEQAREMLRAVHVSPMISLVVGLLVLGWVWAVWLLKCVGKSQECCLCSIRLLEVRGNRAGSAF